MKLAVIGKGKTGSSVIALASSNHEVTVFDSKNQPTVAALQKCEAAIVFVTPTILADIAPVLIDAKIPCVVGTTGFDFSKLHGLQAPWIVASNFSKGMNLLFSIAKLVDNFQAQHPELNIAIREIHHTEKKDSPSGTALFLQKLFQRKPEITALRKGDIKGVHGLELQLAGERLELRHEALDRNVFATGAIWAAENLLRNTPGIHQFENLLTKEKL